MSGDNGNVTTFDRFKRLIAREKIAPPPGIPPPISKEEEAAGVVSDWAKTSETYRSFIVLLDKFQENAEINENSSLANQPLMLFHHGRVAAFKELKVFLESLRRDAPPA